MLFTPITTKLGLGFDVAEQLAAEYDTVGNMLTLVDDAAELSRETSIPIDTAYEILTMARHELRWVERKRKLEKDTNEKLRIEKAIASESMRMTSSESTGPTSKETLGAVLGLVCCVSSRLVISASSWKRRNRAWSLSCWD